MKFFYEFLNLIPKNKVITYWMLWKIFWIHPRKVWYLLKKSDPNKYNCYKVIWNKDIWWYNIWIEEKIIRLKNDWININNINKYVRKPNLWNMFCWILMEDDNFKKLCNELELLNNWSYTIQKSNTPHITLKFFWKLNLKKFHEIINNTKKIKFKSFNIKLKTIDNFNERVYFYKCDYKKIFELYEEFIKINNFIKEEYKPHLTVIRIKNQEKFNLIKDKVIKIISKYEFILNVNNITFFSAVDEYNQVPLVQINLD